MPTTVLVRVVVAAGSIVTCTGPAAVDSSVPLAREMVRVGTVTGSPPPKEKSGGSPATLFEMTTAAAPAAWAFCALTEAAQVPRLTSATAPAGKPVNAAAVQPSC